MKLHPRITARVVVLLLLGLASTEAAIFSVTNANDSGAGSLRQALIDANTTQGHTINFNNSLGTITLASPLPEIIRAMTINGGTGDTISGNNQFRGLVINPPDNSNAVAINGLTIRGIAA
jgi:hypothetical protein